MRFSSARIHRRMKKHGQIKRGQETCSSSHRALYASRHAVMEYRATAYTRAAKASLEIKKNIESREIFAASSQLVHAMR